MVMPFEHREHQADVVLVAWGATLSEAFESGAQGLLELIVDTAGVTPATAVEFSCEAEDVGSLFVTFLNEILFAQDQQGMFFRHGKVMEVAVHNSLQTLRGAAWGEPVDFRKHHVRSEVKAATYGGLHYSVTDGVHRFECIVDV
jgi:SHS2 domain-containing protein